MKLKIFGANLRDQSLGQHVVHAADCRDCAKLHKLGEHYSVEDHDSQESVIRAIYSDQIREGCSFEDCEGEVHFYSCVTIPRMAGPIVEYAIRSTERASEHCYFCAIHGSTPVFSTPDKAKRFKSERDAFVYAFDELFTTSKAFTVERMNPVQ